MKKFLKNIFSSSLPQIMGIIANLVLPPLIIAQYGSEINGLVSTTRIILGYIALVGAGIAAAVTQSLYEPVSRGDEPTVKGMLHAAANMFNKYGFIYILLTLAVSLVYPFFIKNFDRHLLVALLLLVMSLASVSEFFVIGRCRALLYADQKVYVASVIQSLGTLIGLVLAYLLLKAKVNIIIVQLAWSMAYVSRAFLLLAYVNKRYAQYRDFKTVPPIARAVHKRKNAMVHQLSGLVVLGSQTVILTFVVGLEAASIYAVYNIVFAGVYSLCNNLNIAVTPFFGKEYALQRMDRLHVIYNCMEFLYSYLVAFTYGVTMLMLLPFIALYTRRADINYIYPVFAAVFTYVSSFYVLKAMSASLTISAGHFKETQGRAIIEASATFIFSFILAYVWGTMGVLIGTGLALAWRCIDSIWYANKYILHKKNAVSFARAGVVYLTLTGAYFLAQQWNISCQSYLAWIFKACMVSAGVFGFLVLVALVFERKTVGLLLRYAKTRKLPVNETNF